MLENDHCKEEKKMQSKVHGIRKVRFGVAEINEMVKAEFLEKVKF